MLPVSYTHLDVYKRQIYTFTTTGAYFEHYLNVLKDKFILRSIIDIAHQSTTQAFDNPDVYKRQAGKPPLP